MLAAVAAAIAFVWFPRYRPSLRQGERYGVDVSHHQGVIDWARVAADDMSFAYIKATEGGDHVDRRFVENWERAAVAGVERGAYHFFTLCTPGRAQAEHFLEVVPMTSVRCRPLSTWSSPATALLGRRRRRCVASWTSSSPLSSP